MLLHWSPRSPFVHKVMVALEETGLRSRVELTRSVVPTEDPAHAIWSVNPLGQIPTPGQDRAPDFNILHSANLMLVDGEGRMRGVYRADEDGLAELTREAAALVGR